MKSLVTGIVISVASVTFAILLGIAAPWLPAPEVNSSGRTDLQGGTLSLRAEQEERAANTINSAALARYRGPYIVIDRYCNRLFLRTKDTVILEADCSTGSGRELVDAASGRHWKFDTPPGVFIVESKLVNPWWRKPDWAYLEAGEPIPKNENLRYDDEMMGDYAIGFGDGYFIHGTIYERLLGSAVTHGCVRMGAQDLETLYEKTRIGTPVYVF